MNKGHHMSYRCSKVNKKGGSDNEKEKHGLDYMRLPLCLSYMELLREEQKNKHYWDWFPHLQEHAGHVMTLMP